MASSSRKPDSRPCSRLFAVAAISLALVWTALQIIPPRGTHHEAVAFRAKPGAQPLVIAHAGGLGNFPENTLEAFQAAATNSDALELDLRLTRDGVLVTHHDATVERTSNGTGKVMDKNVAELRQLNFGYHFRDASGGYPYRERGAKITSLEELLTRYPEMPMLVELKDRGPDGPTAAKALAKLVAERSAEDRILVASFDLDTLNAFRAASHGRVATSLARPEAKRFVILQKLGLDRLWTSPAAAASLPADPKDSSGVDLRNARVIRAFQARQMAVHYWTVNDPTDMQRLINLGADGLITDYPDRLRALLPNRPPTRYAGGSSSSHP